MSMVEMSLHKHLLPGNSMTSQGVNTIQLSYQNTNIN